jgi:hypothetical protein
VLKNIIASVSIATLGLSLAACSSNNGGVADVTLPGHVGSTVPTSSPATTYTQIELLSRPAVKEVFENFADHQISNAAEPYNDPTLQSRIISTADFVRPPNTTTGTDIGQTLATVLYPNVLRVNLADTTSSANFLAVETGGATGGNFGGRDPNNNVIETELGALFGKTLVSLGVIKEDGEENNCLSSQNLNNPTAQQKTQLATSTFPFLANPH